MERNNLIRNGEKFQFKTALPPTHIRFASGLKYVSIYPMSRGNLKYDFKAHNHTGGNFVYYAVDYSSFTCS